MQTSIATYDVFLGVLDAPNGEQPAVLIHAADRHANVPDAMATFIAPLRKGGVLTFRDCGVSVNNDGSLPVTTDKAPPQAFLRHGTLADLEAGAAGLDTVRDALKHTANKVKDAGDLRALVLQRVTAAASRHYPKAGVYSDHNDRIVVASETTLPETTPAGTGGSPKGKSGPKRRSRQKGVKVWI